MANIIVAGSVNMDLVIRTPRLPGLGETILGENLVMVGGGKGANQAVACARLGAEVSFIGRVGHDEFGNALLKNLKNEGIDCEGVTVSEDINTGVALITVVKEGDNSIVVSPGANMLLSPGDITRQEDKFRNCHASLFQLEVPLETLEEGLRLSKKHGLLTILDPAPFTEIPESFLKLIDILVPNNIELHQMSGLDDMEKAASSIIQGGVKTVVVTAGADGAILFERGSISRIKGPAVSTVDTTGAGDSFAGAMAVALSEGKSTLEAVEFANCAGALACTILGAQPSLPFREDVERIYHQTYRP